VPSVVAVREGQAIVGHAAKRLARTPRFFQHKGSFSETKNEIGLRHTYARAPEGFRSATEIAAHIIRYLTEASGLDGEPVGTGVPGPVFAGMYAWYQAFKRTVMRAGE